MKALARALPVWNEWAKAAQTGKVEEMMERIRMAGAFGLFVAFITMLTGAGTPLFLAALSWLFGVLTGLEVMSPLDHMGLYEFAAMVASLSILLGALGAVVGFFCLIWRR